MDALLLAAIGIVLLSLSLWYLAYNEPLGVDEEATVAQTAHIEVRAGYHPSRVRLKAGRPARLIFNRRETVPCSEQVVFETLGLSADLPHGEDVTIAFTPKKPGIHEFTCQQGVLRGQLLVQ